MPSRFSPLRILFRAVLFVLMSGLLAAILIRFAPGFGMDERCLDLRSSTETIQAIGREDSQMSNPAMYFLRFMGVLILKGNAGNSIVFGRPVTELIRERAPQTIRTVAAGLAIGWIFAMLLAAATVSAGHPAAILTSTLFSGALLSVPSAVLATICLLLELPPGIAVAAVVFPRCFPYAYAQLRNSLLKPHVIMARSRGLSKARVFLFHVAPLAAMPLLALAGVSVPLAFGAAIPIEALADSPGLGQLAWRAALGHDMAVLVTVTLLLTVVAVFASAIAEIIMTRFGTSAL